MRQAWRTGGLKLGELEVPQGAGVVDVDMASLTEWVPSLYFVLRCLGVPLVHHDDHQILGAEAQRQCQVRHRNGWRQR
jgi:hypothetical protein